MHRSGNVHEADEQEEHERRKACGQGHLLLEREAKTGCDQRYANEISDEKLARHKRWNDRRDYTRDDEMFHSEGRKRAGEKYSPEREEPVLQSQLRRAALPQRYPDKKDDCAGDGWQRK